MQTPHGSTARTGTLTLYRAIAFPTSRITPESVPALKTQPLAEAATPTMPTSKASWSLALRLKSWAPPVTVMSTSGFGSFQYLSIR